MGGLGPAWLIGKFDGICGMGLDDISVDGVTTPLRALANSQALDANVFAFYLGHNSAGELMIGGVDTKYTGDFTYHPVVEMVPGKKDTGKWPWMTSRSMYNRLSHQRRVSLILAPLCWHCQPLTSRTLPSSLAPRRFCLFLHSTKSTPSTAMQRLL